MTFSRLVGMDTISGPLCVLGLFHIILSDGSFLIFQEFPHIHALISTLLNTQYSANIWCSLFKFCLYFLCTSMVLYSVKSNCLGLLDFQLHLRECAVLCLSSPSLYYGLKTLSRHDPHLFIILRVTALHSLIASVFKLFHIFFLFSGRRINLLSVSPILVRNGKLELFF